MAASPEALFISAVLQAADVKALGREAINQEMFTGYEDEYRWLSRYIDKHHKIPTKAAFTNKFPEFTIHAVDDVGHYADEVRLAYAESAMTQVMDRSVDLMMKGDIAGAMSSLGTDLIRVQATVQDQADDYDLAADHGGTYELLKQRMDRVASTGSAGVPTGFGSLDIATGGLQPGWLTIIGARLGAGKTWTMVSMAVNAAMHGYSALYYSLEQPRDQIAMRTHTMLSSMWWEETFRGMDLVRGRNFDLMSYRDFLASIEDELAGRIVINDGRRGRVSPMTVAAGIEREEPDIVFIDYLTLMAMKGDGGWLSVGDLSASLQQLGQRYGIPIVVASQLNRGARETDTPDAGMIGRADSVGQDADLVVMLAAKSPHVRRMSIPKFRHGPDGQNFYIEWDPNNGVIEEISGDRAAELIQKDAEVD